MRNVLAQRYEYTHCSAIIYKSDFSVVPFVGVSFCGRMRTIDVFLKCIHVTAPHMHKTHTHTQFFIINKCRKKWQRKARKRVSKSQNPQAKEAERDNGILKRVERNGAVRAASREFKFVCAFCCTIYLPFFLLIISPAIVRGAGQTQ
jgi:hypothetical protein